MQTIFMGEAECEGSPIQYHLLAEEAESGIGEYGVRVIFGEEVASLPRVTRSQTAIIDLITKMIRGTVTPVSAREIVEDWLLA